MLSKIAAGIINSTLLCLFFFPSHSHAQQVNSRFPLIPYPRVLVEGKGNFTINPETTIFADGAFEMEADTLDQLLEPVLDHQLKIGKGLRANSINLQYDAAISAPEAYKLIITPEKVVVRASDPAGIFHAVQTIRQLLPAALESGHARSEERRVGKE